MQIDGPFCFGIVIGYVTYRSLARSGPTSSISDIAAVIGALGGGAITKLFTPESEAFGSYAGGLVLGFALFIVISATLGPAVASKTNGTVLLGGENYKAPTTTGGGANTVRPR